MRVRHRIVRIVHILQSPLLGGLAVTLNAVSNLEIVPVFERDAAFGVHAHLIYVLLLILDIIDDPYHC